MSFEPLKLHVKTVGPKNGNRRVVFSTRGTHFGAFDGYKKSETGSLKLATPDWMEGDEAAAMLRATMEIEIESDKRSSAGIEPSTENPTGWENHWISGRVDRVVNDLSEVVADVSLLDGHDEGEVGSKIDPSSYSNSSAAVISIEDGNMLVDMSDIDQTIAVNSVIRVRSSRLDIVGYLEP
ncbi:hypothetical protein [Halosimplex pelagicum]|uniref:Uncharacterized protein n=1 Tax=Halosimplex pelagicum TaxID=869886 RepID=A0A7D5TBL1_9EURY|nr:hypothetical protein [Halosimplex pelagicum]QLH81395.1 hypothetical protein HZS54_07035 [Halosimplex pelagicum]